jgi:AcrR family transcriptional regulator
MSWLSAERTEVGADRILNAAAELFAERGIGRPGMEEIARAAGCSRATVYRYFDSKDALLKAFVHREALDITEQVAEQISRSDADGSNAVVEAVVATLAAIRLRPYLRPWYAESDTTVLFNVLHSSPLVARLAEDFLRHEKGEPDADLGRWVVRIVMSFLREPEADQDEERRLLERFLA